MTSSNLRECQICARMIRTPHHGCIAKHGYRQPRAWGGNRSGTCLGSDYLPYDQSCKAIIRAIEITRKFIAGVAEAIEDMQASPPEKLAMTRRPQEALKPTVYLDRPDGFDPHDRPAVYTPRTYESEFWSLFNDRTRAHRDATGDLKALKERLSAWNPPFTLDSNHQEVVDRSTALTV